MSESKHDSTRRQFLYQVGGAFALGGLWSSRSAGAEEKAKRPRITGVSHMALYVKDMDKSRAFHKDFLGYAEAFQLDRPEDKPKPAYFKISDRQWIELYPEEKSQTDRLKHIGLQTDDAESLRTYLAGRGIKVPDKAARGRLGNLSFTVTDPDGHALEFVQYQPDSVNTRDQGKNLSDSRIATRLTHTGIMVASLQRALAFYADILGCREIWRGSPPDGKVLAWVHMAVPEGDDSIEFMLYKDPPTFARMAGYHHMCLEVPDVAKTKAALAERPAAKVFSRNPGVFVATNNRRLMNVVDPDGTRVEFMEPNTIDGKPAPPSTALPPNP